MVKLLLNKGANLSAIDKKERQPIHSAAYLGKKVSLLAVLYGQSFASQSEYERLNRFFIYFFSVDWWN